VVIVSNYSTIYNNIYAGVGSGGYIYNLGSIGGAKATNNVASFSFWYNNGNGSTGSTYTGTRYYGTILASNSNYAFGWGDVWKGIKSVGNGVKSFVQGVGSAVLESATLDASSQLEVYYDKGNETIYLVGKTIGSVGMTVIGTISTVACAGGDIIVTPTGVGELVTVPATAYCAGVTGVSAVNAGKNLGQIINKIKNDSGSSGGSKTPSASEIAEAARNSKKIDGLSGTKVPQSTVDEAALEFCGKDATVYELNGVKQYRSANGNKTVRVDTKVQKSNQSGSDVWEANFETWENGEAITNYHVTVKK
jgi:hypothetical protein